MRTNPLVPVVLLSCSLLVMVALMGCGGDRPPTDWAAGAADVDVAADEMAAPTFGKNLVKNGGFEVDSGGDGSTLIRPSRWVPGSPVGDATVVTYGAPGGFPTVASPGPPSRGKNFVAGGKGYGESQLFQRVNVSWAAATIDAGDAQCVIAAFLGGYGAQQDRVSIQFELRDATLWEIRQATVTSVTAADRGNQTGLLRRFWKGKLPVGTRYIDLHPIFTRYSGPYNDGYLDAVSVKLNDLTP
ncbi:MAG: hypothetical protein FJX75_20775 [Armatimonadetes bacterium]|nr:hypothetical protein [Armatimonadota bacterium]